ncbi:MFS domain-containing protein [Aphelenchoides bicaudatus]|nr:MFS domain-containing protein [Aphelenchoides bicaudatus]
MAVGPWKNRYRYVILVVGLLCLTSISSNTLAFNLAQVCMASNSQTNSTDDDIVSRAPRIDYTPSEISLINGAMALGITVATIPCTMSFSHFGMRWPLFISGMLSALSTFLMPFAAMKSFYILLFLRLIQGIAYSANLPAVGKLCSSWSSLKQTGVFISVLTSYMALSSGLTNSLGAMLCETDYGWPLVFYAHGAVCMLLFAAWLLCYDDLPSTSKQVSPKELTKINHNKTKDQLHHGNVKMPYKNLLADVLVWVIWINAFAEFFITVFLTLYSPYYLRNALKYNIEKTGHYAAISRIMQVPFRLAFGIASDKIKFFDDNVKLVLFNSIALGGAGLSLIGLGFVPDDYPIVGVILLTVISMVTGAASSGFFKGAVLYTRQYSQFVIGNCQLIKCGILFLAPLAVAVFVQNSADKSQWRWIFLLAGITAIIANCLFFRFSQATPALYTAEGFFDQNLQQQTADPLNLAAEKLELPAKEAV